MPTNLEVERLEIPDILVLKPRKFGDNRGFFSEVYNRASFAECGIGVDFIQDNHSLSATKGTIRGLHLQAPPFEQAKLVRVTKGRILDVALDIRKSSPTYGKHAACEISAEDWNQVYVPPGFAHGFCTLEPDTEVIYKVAKPYAPEHEMGVLFSDPALGIDWGVDPAQATTSDKDLKYPTLADFDSPFA